MLKGLLRPAEVTADRWLLPVMTTAWRRQLGEEAPRHYPKGPVILPAERLGEVFKDDTLHCVCNNLCCDRIRVFVEGDHLADAEKPPEFLLDGGGRDYKLHLELVPLQERCRLEIPLDIELSASSLPEATHKIQRRLAVVQNVRGVIFQRFDFNIILNIHCFSLDRDKVRFLVQSLLDCVRNCPGSAFRDCTASIKLQIHNLNHPKHSFIEIIEKPDRPGHGGGPGWGGGGAGGGSGGGSGGPGWPGWGSGSYDWPKDGEDKDEGEDEEKGPFLPFGEADTILRSACWSDCPGAVFYNCRAIIDLEAESRIGADSLTYAWRNCGGWIHRSCSASIANRVRVSGSGQSWSDSQGASGIYDYALSARAYSTLIAGSGCGEISHFRGSAASQAFAVAEGPSPYTTDKDGATSHRPIGGSSQAIAYGLYSNSGGSISHCHADCNANARHPVRYASLALPYRGNQAEHSGNSGSPANCASNQAGWCDANL